MVDIAIIGMSCRLPGARNYHEYWSNLIEGRSSIREIPKERWDWRDYWGDPKVEYAKTNSKWGGFIDDVDAFDAAFFGISAREAEVMDPQQRMMLELSWSCLEDAGIVPSALSGSKTGVYIGVFNLDYKELQERPSSLIEAHYSTGTAAAVIANRISHFMNLRGPSLSVDTSCSSSLQAIHLAVQSLQTGECSMALAGGVSLILTPTRHISFSRTGMLSPTGSCKTFDDNADGYVRSEGAGLILLKPLALAEKDGDLIHGVIKGSAVNHVGKTHTLTYPNAQAQAEVIEEAFRKAGLTPDQVNYMEAHGTGTPKGDPIEFQGLTLAFQKLEAEMDKPLSHRYCGIGSAKTNIGHAESAAGIAGVIKVLLSMKHRTLPGLQNFKTLNHRVELTDSPFYMVDRPREWEPLLDHNQQPLPRRAGVSSFGFGGTNGHVLIEEAPQRPSHKMAQNGLPCHLFCFSAKSEKSLLLSLETFVAWLDSEGSECEAADLSAALLLRKQHFGIRTAIAAQSVEELKGRLKELLSDRKEAQQFLKQEASKIEKTKTALFQELAGLLIRDLRECVNDTQKYREKISALAELYVKGYDFDSLALFEGMDLNRLRLPTYAFTKERYWITGNAPESAIVPTSGSGGVGELHPVLHRNTSDFAGVRYSSVFTGEEFFLAHHVVAGKRVLPGVVYLEMVREAAEQAGRKWLGERKRIVLNRVVWSKPVIVTDSSVEVHVSLSVQNDDSCSFQVYSVSGESEQDRVLHCEGHVSFRSADPASRKLQIQDFLNSGRTPVPSLVCYERMGGMGLHYGPAHQGIEQLYQMDGIIAAKLLLPEPISDTRNHFILHPSLMDAALQTAVYGYSNARQTAVGESGNPLLPFTLRELEIIRPCSSAAWAIVSEEEPEDSKMTKRLRIDVCDEDGSVCVSIKGFVLRPLEGGFADGVSDPVKPEASKAYAGLMVPLWDPITLAARKTDAPNIRTVIAGGSAASRDKIWRVIPNALDVQLQVEDDLKVLARKLEKCGEIGHFVWIAPDDSIESAESDAMLAAQHEGVLFLFRIIKVLLLLGYGAKPLKWSVITFQTVQVSQKETIRPAHASLHGLIGSMAKEYPNWSVSFGDLEQGDAWPIEELIALPPDERGDVWAYRSKEWYRQKMIPAQIPKPEGTAYRKGGVYAVIGGTGGIGEAWSEYMIRQYQANIVWIGRREIDTGIQEKIDRLSKLGPSPCYIQADAKDGKALELAYESIKSSYGRIHGVIHSAIVLLDQSLANMSEERFAAGLTAKVDVSVRIAQVFRREPLDFVLFFSSMNSFAKPGGQSNYAAGCTFKDAFAQRLAMEWPCKVKVINWGYWGGTGIVSSEHYRKRMAQAGVGSIESEEAMDALETLLAGPFDQMMLIKTTKPYPLIDMKHDEWISNYPEQLSSNIQRLITERKRRSASEQEYPVAASSVSADETADPVLTYLSGLAAEWLRVDFGEIDVDTRLEEYGIDAIVLNEMLMSVNQQYHIDLQPAELSAQASLRQIGSCVREAIRIGADKS
ncbi:type I polyketide synthase [Brevibacillus formosus]|uniref:type I polyketide synthase n=1 Tax=Brevibacillus formosus TaxID=54913 RepID=UPI0018CDBE2A|nr:type I polyketide synthase [Brevibacillus formosus]